MNIPCTVNKKSSNGKAFVKCSEVTLNNLYKEYANSITATYCRHPDSCDGSNLIIEVKYE